MGPDPVTSEELLMSFNAKSFNTSSPSEPQFTHEKREKIIISVLFSSSDCCEDQILCGASEFSSIHYPR